MEDKVLILTIDGGGTRGIIPTKILYLLEQDINKKIFDTFDIYAGTSTGSIVICAIAGLKKSPAEMLNDLYSQKFINGIFRKRFGIFNFLSIIFGSKYLGSSKTKVLNGYFGQTQFSDITKPTLITSFNLNRSTAAIFKSNSGSMTNKCNNIATIVDASTSAPTYFPPININNELYVDGGICANNPAVASLSYALSLGYKLNNIKILSLGTGRYINKLDGNPKEYGPLGWLKNGLIDDLFTGSSSVNDYNLDLILNQHGNNFLRINPILEKNIHLDDCSHQALQALDQIACETYKNNKSKLIDFVKQINDSNINNLKVNF